jgi:AcrR family transcriptional regulator
MDTYHRLLEAALKLFCQRGYDAVGVQEIVNEARTTKPPLYHHFGSKQGLLETLLESHYEPWLKRLESLTEYNGDLPLTIYNVAHAIFQFAGANPTFYRLQLSLWFSALASVPHRVVAPHLLRQHLLLESLFTKASQDHPNLRGPHKAYAVTFMGMINGYISALSSSGLQATDEIVHAVVRQFMYGMFAL